MPLLQLPEELLLLIISQLTETFDINACARTCGRLHRVANDRLYKDNILHHHSSGLFWAAKRDREETVHLFLSAGADVNTLDEWKLTPLVIAVQRGHVATVRCLLADERVNVSQIGNNTCSPLLSAAIEGHHEVVKLLLADKRLQPDVDCYQEWSPLDMAVAEGHVEVVKILLSSGLFDVNREEAPGRTAFTLAAANGHVEIAKLLMADPRIKIDPRSHGYRALCDAAERGYPEMTRFLIREGFDAQQKADDGKTLLHLAVRGAQAPVVKLLLDEGLDPNATDQASMTPLLIAMKEVAGALAGLIEDAWCSCVFDSRELEKEEQALVEILRLLLSAGANPNLTDILGETPLYWAAEGDFEKGARTLLEDDRVDPLLKDHEGKSLLMVVVGHALVELLLTKGMPLDDVDKHGNTALSIAENLGYDWMVKFLRQAASKS